MFEASVKSGFSGAHRLKGYRGKCEGIHGHNWDVEARVRARGLDRTGLSVDFKLLKQKLNDVLAEMDHSDLNRLAPFKDSNPSAENIAKYIYGKLKKSLIGAEGIELSCVRVWEAKDSCAAYFE